MLKTKRIEGMKIDDENSRKLERARILPVEEKAEHTSCFGRCRSSLNTATALGFIILFLDAMLLTALEPILPDIVRHLKGVPEFLQGEKYNEIMNDNVGNVTFFGPTPTSSLAVGIVFSAKPFMELMANPLVGCAVDKFGYEAPMHCGYFVSFISALGLAFSNSYLLLFISRCIQGIGNVLLVISTLAFLSHIHGDTPGRSAAFAVAFIGVGVGALVGFPYGGFVYEYVGREYPYLILGILIILAWCFRVWYKPTLYDKFQTQSNFFSYFKMCLDPYLLVAVVLWIAVSFSVSGLLVSVPLQAMDEYNERPFHIGILFLTSASVQIITQALLAKHTHKIGWWKVCFAGGLLQPCTFLLFVAMPSFWWLTFPMAIGGLSMGLFLSSFHALLCHITDVRFGPNYGAAFSLNKIGYGIGVFSGSVIFSILIHHYGYDTTFFVAAGITFVTSLGALFLRNVPNLYETELDDKAKE